MRVLLTGANGFVGKNVLNCLKKKKIYTKIIIRKDKKINFKKKEKNLEIVTTKDLFKESVKWWNDKCKDIDVIIHLAWYLKSNDYLQSRKNIQCLKGSLNLARGAINAGVKRFVGIGTCFEYNLEVGKLSISTELKPTTLYSSTKVKLFKSLTSLFKKKKINFCWCRLFYLFGKNQDKEKLVPQLHKKLSKGKLVKLTDGSQVRDFLNVSDASQIITNVALGKKSGPINVCSGIPITVRELAEKIADEYNGRSLLKFGARPDNLVDPKYVVGVPNY